MKTLILMTFLSSLAFAQNFKCVNHMYRTSVLEYSSHAVKISDDYINGRPELQKAVREELGLSSDFTISHVELVLGPNDIACTVGENFQLVCHGPGKRGALSVKDWITHRGGFKIELNVGVPHFEVIAQTANARLTANASAQLVLGRRTVDVSWRTFFYPRPDGAGSHCKHF